MIRSHQDNDGGVHIAIEDSGPGIEPDQMDRLFNAFFSTKAQGDKAVANSSLEWTILRPCWFYGPGQPPRPRLPERAHG